MRGFEPLTSALQRRYSPIELHPQTYMGLDGLEPTTLPLSEECSNQLSYKPKVYKQLKSDKN